MVVSVAVPLGAVPLGLVAAAVAALGVAVDVAVGLEVVARRILRGLLDLVAVRPLAVPILAALHLGHLELLSLHSLALSFRHKTRFGARIFHPALPVCNRRCNSGGVRAARASFGRSWAALADSFRNPDLRRIQLAWVGSVIGNWSYSVALAVYAYRQGGPAAVGLVAVIRLLPSALAAPFVALAADRFPRARVMVAADLGRAPLMGLAALTILLDGPAPIVYAAVGLASVIGTAFRPAQAALLPSLARTPHELSAANVASSTFESIGSFVGPALGGLLLVVSSVEAVFGLNALTFLWSALMVARIQGGGGSEPAGEPAPRVSLAQEVGAGFRVLAVERDLRLIVGLYAAQTLVAGAFGVLVVVSALELLAMGDAGVGLLNSAVGVGGLLGALVALMLAARGRLALDFGLGVALYGAPLALVALWREPAAALLLLGVSGVGNTLTDISALTLMQRTVADDVLARVFGVLESILLASIGLGAVLAPLLIELLGVRGALLATGAFLPVVVLLGVARLRAVDARAPGRERVALLAAHPIFSPLSQLTLEQLAGRLEERVAAAGEQVVEVGGVGDSFYLIEEGEAEAAVDGRVVELGPGEGFGEIALLRDVPRTATVTARGPLRLLVLERGDFLDAVLGHVGSARAADALVAGRLGGVGSGVASA